MNRLKKLRQSEECFQQWFRSSFQVHQCANPTSKTFRDVGSPYSSGKYSGYDCLFKRTVRVTPAFAANPNGFLPELVDFLVVNTLLLYSDSVRISSSDTHAAFFKDCGNHVGGVYCALHREGNLVTLSVSYQIFHKFNSILMQPTAMKACTSSRIRGSAAWAAYRRMRFFYLKRFLGFITTTSLAFGVAIALFSSGNGILCFVGFLVGCGGLGYIGECWKRWVGGLVAAERAQRRDVATKHLQQDLSPVHFPVLFFDQESITDAVARNPDHQVFIERISSIVGKAVSLGEQAH